MIPSSTTEPPYFAPLPPGLPAIKLYIQLGRHYKPPIYRTVLVSPTWTLFQLHLLISCLFGYDGKCLQEFDLTNHPTVPACKRRRKNDPDPTTDPYYFPRPPQPLRISKSSEQANEGSLTLGEVFLPTDPENWKLNQRREELVTLTFLNGFRKHNIKYLGTEENVNPTELYPKCVAGAQCHPTERLIPTQPIYEDGDNPGDNDKEDWCPDGRAGWDAKTGKFRKARALERFGTLYRWEWDVAKGPQGWKAIIGEFEKFVVPEGHEWRFTGKGNPFDDEEDILEDLIDEDDVLVEVYGRGESDDEGDVLENLVDG
ncbi:hypothetical protein HK104_008283 [Borealophlyctis nickersoniae]|nr:hypothetical protein HK104_008283 [Borealophlyctis nickersoniae]